MIPGHEKCSNDRGASLLSCSTVNNNFAISMIVNPGDNFAERFEHTVVFGWVIIDGYSNSKPFHRKIIGTVYNEPT
jgi:hypothetical protein